ADDRQQPISENTPGKCNCGGEKLRRCIKPVQFRRRAGRCERDVLAALSESANPASATRRKAPGTWWIALHSEERNGPRTRSDAAGCADGPDAPGKEHTAPDHYLCGSRCGNGDVRSS